MIMDKKFKEVTKKEFKLFIKEYPASLLNSGISAICEPPIRHFRDESLPTTGKHGSADYFFDKEVARISLDWLGPNKEIDDKGHGNFWKYYILK